MHDKQTKASMKNINIFDKKRWLCYTQKKDITK